VKELLLTLLAEIEDLRANVGLLAAHAEHQPESHEVFLKALALAKRNNQARYDEIRTAIEKLAL
jgi:hypothetical protein